jgi:crotonobetainyl-CoA:carnitine CoA-transferase CaiB-like acyl-CoA transferase
MSERNANRDQLRRILEDALAARTAAEWFEVLTGVGIPCSPINDVAQGVALGESLGLQPVVPVGSGDRTLPGIANPIRFSESEVSYRLTPPILNEDADEIRAWLETTPPRHRQHELDGAGSVRAQ